MPKDYTVEDYSHPSSEHGRYVGPVHFGIPYERQDDDREAEGGVPPSASQETVA